MQYLQNRNSIAKLIPQNAVIAEVGVFEGEYSKYLYKECKPNTMYLIDIFNSTTGSGDKDGNNMKTVNLNDVFDSLSLYYNNQNVFLLKGYSSAVIPHLEDNILDFIYIDASHHYEDVKSDLYISYSKVKKGGIISGHDYCTKSFPEVVQAVKEFCEEYNQTISYITQEDGLPSFVIYKS